MCSCIYVSKKANMYSSKYEKIVYKNNLKMYIKHRKKIQINLLGWIKKTLQLFEVSKPAITYYNHINFYIRLFLIKFQNSIYIKSASYLLLDNVFVHARFEKVLFTHDLNKI